MKHKEKLNKQKERQKEVKRNINKKIDDLEQGLYDKLGITLKQKKGRASYSAAPSWRLRLSLMNSLR